MSYLLTIPFTSSTLSLPLKGGLSVGLLGVSSVTAGISTWQNQHVSIDDEVKQVFNKTIPSFFKEELGGGGELIFNAYKTWNQELNDVITTDNTLLKTMGAWGETIRGGVSKESISKIQGFFKVAEEINYYIFKFSEIVRQFAEAIPTIITDTIQEANAGANNEVEALSFGKIESIFSSDKFDPFYKSLEEVSAQFAETLSGINSKQSNAILQVFRSEKKSKINDLLEEIKKNAEKVKKEENKYKNNLDKLLTDVFIGEGKIQALKQMITSLKQSVSTKTEALKKIVDMSLITSLEQHLENLKTQMSANN
ncbi:hypothetical protein MHSWG343_04470 [Candidatus Mycoplasma haematohominis]|uniref:Uncharacterized protein n=1 Tax=Candidatus Mycoplasma haematohominis TaxID=1494318 RepID=A0A478FTU2_9MOLU|nr:hypothetical protein MHSWG343_04470 [Candidatus Mycoplasma haemohominis]